ncbi:MAG TPA: glycosyltransferase [Candidatus Syntrophosphaera sp.]|nr:glycosyltransferase [Candidatus Syntrophosphaera sp.]
MDSISKIKCSLGVFAYNEAENILPLLEALVNQKLEKVEIEEIIVVSSGSTDGTDELVTQFAQLHPQVRLIRQAKREGKASAINIFIKEAKSDILVVISGDVIPAPTTIEKLVSAFEDPTIGATGGRPIPVNDDHTFMGYAVHLLWRLHHRMALISPKLGEMIAFRKVMDSIPSDSAVDEASIEAIVQSQGYKLKYIPDAVIKNKGPLNLKDFIKQRRRIQNGHIWLKKKQNYEVSSQDMGTLLKVVLEEIKEYPSTAFKVIAVMLLEAFCRLLGSFDFYVKKKNPFAWDIARSTKNLHH